MSRLLANTDEPFRCPNCGATSVRRSMPRTIGERFIRASTPYHLFLCRACEHRGWSRVRVGPASQGDEERGELPARPVEIRDLLAKKRRRQGIFASFLLAALLGTAAGAYLHSCQQTAELQRLPAE